MHFLSHKLLKAQLNVISGSPSSSPRPLTPNSLKRLRFAEQEVSGVHVYESQPPSPRKKPLALPAPTEEDKDAVPLLARGYGPRITLQERPMEDDEGTPEDIRRRFFPDASPHEPSLEWITSGEGSAENPSGIRFDLIGDPIPAELLEKLPTHLGLHHHSGSLAGYTIDDLLLLSRSTVPAQRTAMLEVLSGVLRNLRRGETSRGCPLSSDLISKKDGLRGRILAAGVEALSGKGTTVVRATELVWEGIVQWDNSFIMATQDISVELEQPRTDGSISSTPGQARAPEFGDPISALPLQQILPFVAAEFFVPILPVAALYQLLQVLYRLTCHSCAFAGRVLTTPNLLASTLSCFVIAPSEPESLNPLAIELLNVIAQSSREAALSIIDTGLADKLLRFIALLPEVPGPTSNVNPNLTSVPIVSHTLRLYRTLGMYGLLTHVASAASQSFTSLAALVMDFARRIEDAPGEDDEAVCAGLCKAWLELLEVWMICAQDPHRTTPPHDIRWSQVVAWGWSQDLTTFCDIWRKMPTRISMYLAAALWNALAAWVEGLGVNGSRGGEEGKMQIIEVLAVGFSNGTEKRIVELALDGVALTSTNTFSQDDVGNIARSASVLGSGVRLVTALLSSNTTSGSGTPQAPFPFPLHQIHRNCMCLVQPNVWTQLCDLQPRHRSYTALRPITSLYERHLQLLHTLKLGTSREWVNEALVGLLRLIPGDEDYGVWNVSQICALIDQEYAAAVLSDWSIPSDIWSQGGIRPISSLLSSALQPQAWPAEDENDLKLVVYLAPYTASPRSISRSTRITHPSAGMMATKYGSFDLPIAPDWPFTPIDELLHSGTSGAFRKLGEHASIPDSNELPELSELDVVRATLVFAGAFRQANRTVGGFSHTHVLFAGMKLIMLEQGSRDDTSSKEIFRDAFVSDSLLTLLTETRQLGQLRGTSDDVVKSQTLEMVSARFLGTATPFYQFYSDFVGLYDAISFSDPLFASLLLPPLAMNYPVDYRKLLWTDYNHVLRTVRTDASHPAILDLTAFLWPIEKDTQLVDAYISALCQRPGSPHGLLRDIAVHHVAYHMWPDLRVSNDATYIPSLQSTETRDSAITTPAALVDMAVWAKRLFLLATASNDVVCDVILYNRSPGSLSRTEELSSELRAERMERVALYGGKALEGRLYTLLKT